METQTESPANGAAPPASVKPWIAAGFTSRDAWRASKGQKTAKSPAKPKAKKASVKAAASKKLAAKKAKTMVAKKGKWASTFMEDKAKKLRAKKIKMAAKKIKAKPSKAKSKHKTPSKPGKGMIKDASLKPVHLADLSANVRKVFGAMGKGKTATLEEIQEKAFPSLPHAKGSSRVRNQLRFLRVHRMVKRLGDGKYRRTA